MKRLQRDLTRDHRFERLSALPLTAAIGFAVVEPADARWALATMATALAWIVGYQVVRVRSGRR